MNKDSRLLQEWMLHLIQTEYAQDVDIAVSLMDLGINGDEHGECFDYFIPATPRGMELEQAVMIKGIGRKFYAHTWDEIYENTQGGSLFMTSLAKAKVIYYRNETALQRFQDMVSLFWSNLKDKDFQMEKAETFINDAMDRLPRFLFADTLGEARTQAGNILTKLAVSLAFLNGKCLSQYNENLDEFPLLPPQFLTIRDEALNSNDCSAFKDGICRLVSCTYTYVLSQIRENEKEETSPVYSRDHLVFWYEQNSMHFERVRYFCQTGDAQRAFLSGSYLQSSLNIASDEFGISLDPLMDCYDAADLSRMEERLDMIRDQLLHLIREYGNPLIDYKDAEAFIADQRRDQ